MDGELPLPDGELVRTDGERVLSDGELVRLGERLVRPGMGLSPYGRTASPDGRAAHPGWALVPEWRRLRDCGILKSRERRSGTGMRALGRLRQLVGSFLDRHRERRPHPAGEAGATKAARRAWTLRGIETLESCRRAAGTP